MVVRGQNVLIIPNIIIPNNIIPNNILPNIIIPNNIIPNIIIPNNLSRPLGNGCGGPGRARCCGSTWHSGPLAWCLNSFCNCRLSQIDCFGLEVQEKYLYTWFKMWRPAGMSSWTFGSWTLSVMLWRKYVGIGKSSYLIIVIINFTMFFRHVVKEVDVGERPAGELLSLLSSLLLVVVWRLKIVWSLFPMFLSRSDLYNCPRQQQFHQHCTFCHDYWYTTKVTTKEVQQDERGKGKEVEKGWELKIDNNNQPHLLHHVHPTIVLPWDNQLVHIQQSDPVIPVTKNPTWLQH